MKRLVRNRRGISQIVTMAILLTTMAVLGSALVTWSNSNLKGFETSLLTTSNNMTNQVNENFVIENIVFCKNICGIPAGQSFINVTVTNTGSVPVQIDKIQINGTSGIIVTGHSQRTTIPFQLPAGKAITMDLKIPAPPLKTFWVSKVPVTISVISHRGTIITTQAAPP